MHTQEVIYEDDEGGRKKERKFFVHHNGDWSGDAIIVEEDGTLHGKQVAEFPAILLVVCGRNAAISEAISALEYLYMGKRGDDYSERLKRDRVKPQARLGRLRKTRAKKP